MKDGWTRQSPEIALDASAITALLQPAFPGARVTGIEPMRGGLINTNLKVSATGIAGPVVLRLYQRDVASARKEVAVTARVAGSLPVARFLYFSDRDPLTGLPYGITEWIEGNRLDAVVGSLDGPAARSLGRAVGHVLAAIHGFTFEKHGFFAGNLEVSEPIDMGRSGAIAYLRQDLVEGAAGALLGAELCAAVLSFAEREGELLDRWLDPPCLVHGDFNGPNILVRAGRDNRWEVAAVLDWEFALSASPALDFGNVLRPPLGSDSAFIAALADGYRDAGGWLPPEWQRVARLADLLAWTDMLSRPLGPAMIADARRIVRDIIVGEPC
jgi:aminoglycoside phosphotransferase (APT) family kinase protein